MSTPPEPDLRALLEQEDRHDNVLRRRLAFLSLVVPPALAIVLLALAAVFRGPAFAGTLVGQAVLIFTVLGKFAILQSAVVSHGLNEWELASLVAYMDISVATVLVYNLPRLYRLKRIGPTLEDLAEHGLYMLERQRWLGRVTFVGVVAFVMFPLTGTGAIGGSIFGRLLGLSPRRTLVAIAMGALIGSFGMAAFADAVNRFFTPELRASWEFRITGAAVLGLMIFAVWHRGRRITRELRARRAARNPTNGVGHRP